MVQNKQGGIYKDAQPTGPSVRPKRQASLIDVSRQLRKQQKDTETENFGIEQLPPEKVARYTDWWSKTLHSKSFGSQDSDTRGRHNMG